jgi:cytochrome c-type biogenesis protein
MAAYVGLAALIVYAGLNIQAIALFLQDYGEKLLGPFLVAMGILMLGIVDIPLPGGHGSLQRLEAALAERGYLGGFLLGVVFALAFCPFSAVLFFGMLIPIAFETGDAILVPAVFALATGLPVIIVSLLLVSGVKRVSGMMAAAQKMEKWVKRAVAAVFIGVGIYYIVIVYGHLVGGV